MIHFAFEVENEDGLKAKQSALRSKSVDVTDVVDHGWCKSIYFRDPNGLQLEFCTTTATLDDANLEDLESAAWKRWSRS
jgi:catechol-2,3-dioxygenase